MHGLNQIERNNSSIPFSSKPGAYTARSIEIAARLSPGERNIMNQSGQLPPIVADQVRREGFDDFALAKLVRERVEADAPLREAELRKIGDRYVPDRPVRDTPRGKETSKGRGLYGRGY